MCGPCTVHDHEGCIPKRRAYLDLSAQTLEVILSATAELPDEVFSLTLTDDQTGLVLGKLTKPGTRLLHRMLAEHHCKPSDDGDQICAVMYLAWVLQGCRSEDETFAEAFSRNGVRLVEKAGE